MHIVLKVEDKKGEARYFMYNNLAVLAIFALVYSAVAGRIERSWLSVNPMIAALGTKLAKGLREGPTLRE